MGEIIVAITGASGAIYGLRLIEVLSDLGIHLRVIVTESAKLTLKHECDFEIEQFKSMENIILEDNEDIAAKSASGSAKIDAMVIVPCSGTTLGKLAAGIGDNLVTRSAIVSMKERRKLILVARETPYNLIHIENMKKITSSGGIICPATPSFYSKPENFDELAATVIDRVINLAEIKHDHYMWGEQ